MKKIIGILGIAALSFGVYFTTNAATLSSDISLASLVSLNTANGEDGATVKCTDIENPGTGSFRVYRICETCDWDDYTPTGNYGTCTF